MKRLLKYCLILVFVFILLGMVVPLGLFAYKYSSIDPIDPNSIEYIKLNNPKENGLIIGSVLSIVIFNLAAAITLFLQQFFWIKLNKKEQYPVPTKLVKKYSIVGYLCVILIAINVIWSSFAFASNINAGTVKNSCFIRIWVYGAGLIVNSILTFSIMGYSEYINLQILYNQNVQMVDEGIANGTYDPITRMPIEKEIETDNKQEFEDIVIPDLKSDDSINLSDKILEQD